MKTPEEVRKAMREQLVPRLTIVLDLAEEAIEEWRQNRPEGKEIAYAGELELSERLMLAQMCVNIMGQAALEDLRKQGPPPAYRVAPPLTDEQVRDAEKAMRDSIENGGVPGFPVVEVPMPTPKQAEDAEKELGKVLESADVSKKQWDAIEEFLKINEHAWVVIQLIMAGK